MTITGIVSADEITLGADIWPTFNGEPGSESPGYMIEVAQKVFKAKGHTVNYKEVPWTRAIVTCRKGGITGVVGAAVGDAEDFVFPTESLGMLENFAFVLKDSTWKYDGADSLAKVKIGLIQDYDYGKKVMNYLKKNKGSK